MNEGGRAASRFVCLWALEDESQKPKAKSQKPLATFIRREETRLYIDICEGIPRSEN